jgi:hypothetical protein
MKFYQIHPRVGFYGPGGKAVAHPHRAIRARFAQVESLAGGNTVVDHARISQEQNFPALHGWNAG